MQTFLLFIFLAGLSPSLAQAAVIPIKNFTPTQERVNKNGVLISRPVPAQSQLKTLLQAQSITSIDDYAAWLTKTMTYTTARSHEPWVTDSQHFLKNRRGDCKDFATLNFQALKMFGFTPHILTLTANRGGHAICAFQYQGKMYWLDNNQLRASKTTNINELGKELAIELNYLKSQEIDLSTKTSTLLYSKS